MTQCEAVINYIKAHGEITQLEALNVLGCMRLASRISDLKQAGNPILTEFRSVRNNQGEIKRFAVYSLEC